MDQPLCKYYINSSHNTYLSGIKSYFSLIALNRPYYKIKSGSLKTWKRRIDVTIFYVLNSLRDQKNITNTLPRTHFIFVWYHFRPKLKIWNFKSPLQKREARIWVKAVFGSPICTYINRLAKLTIGCIVFVYLQIGLKPHEKNMSPYFF